MWYRTLISGIIITTIFIVLFVLFIVEHRNPNQLVGKRFYADVSMSDMRCILSLDDKHVLVDTDNYNFEPYLASYQQGIMNNKQLIDGEDIFSSKMHTIKLAAMPLDNPRGQNRADQYCDIHLYGYIFGGQLEKRYSASKQIRITFDKDGEALITSHHKELNEYIKLEGVVGRADNGAIQAISITQDYPIFYQLKTQ